MRARAVAPLVAVALVMLLTGVRQLGTAFGQPGTSPHSPASTPSVAGRWDGETPSRGQIQTSLQRVTVQTAPRAHRPGYDRACGSGHVCGFGSAWTDDTTAAMGHNGCDQRNDLLRASLSGITLRAGTHGCVVEVGTLQDPYTGATIHFTKAKASMVQVDHLYPLSLAWDMGAADWSLKRRTRFATDPLNLNAVDGSSNESKGDQGPGEWMPPNRAYRCTYVERFLKVAIAYKLPVTKIDASSIAKTGATCPSRPAPGH